MKRSTMRALLAAGDEMENDLGVGGRLADGALLDQLAAQRQGVGEVAVVREREAAEFELGKERLHVAQDRLAAGRVAHVADRDVARQALDHGPRGEMVADEAERRSEWNCVPSKLTMPAASWPRCWRAWRPSAVSAAASAVAEDAEDAALLAQRSRRRASSKPRRLTATCSAIGPLASKTGK